VGGQALLAGINMEVAPGCVTAVIGPNGAGKSTLLRILSGEIAPTRGPVRLDGRALRTFSAAELARRRAVVPQASAMSFPFTVREVVMLGVAVPGFPLSAALLGDRCEEALDAVGLAPFAERLYPTLSGGERQRVHIAQALCQLAAAPPSREDATRCFLLDEPTASLDLAHQAYVLGAIRQQARRNHAVLAILHDLNLAAAAADHIVLLAAGRMTAAGSPREVLRDDLLSTAYGCQVTANRIPYDGKPFVLPPAMFLDACAPR
jgi:iron complex transport system ATP-binding protein